MAPRIVRVEPHGPLREVLPGLHMVRGSMRLGPARFSRNMVVIARGDDVVLVNSVRLDARGLEALDAIGRVTDVVRLAAGHGRDDPFYKARYGATVWDIAGQRYYEGMRWDAGATYFESDHGLDGEVIPPLPGGRLFHFGTTPPEAALLLPHAGGTLISGDALHNWSDANTHFNRVGRLMFRLLGFVGPHRLGKGWLDGCQPDPQRLRELLECGFENVLPAHGDPVLGRASERYRAAVEAYATRAERAGLSRRERALGRCGCCLARAARRDPSTTRRPARSKR